MHKQRAIKMRRITMIFIALQFNSPYMSISIIFSLIVSITSFFFLFLWKNGWRSKNKNRSNTKSIEKVILNLPLFSAGNGKLIHRHWCRWYRCIYVWWAMCQRCDKLFTNGKYNLSKHYETISIESLIWNYGPK